MWIECTAGAGARRERTVKDSVGEDGRVGGGGVGGGVPLHAGGFFRHRPGHHRRWRSNHCCLVSQDLC